MVSQYFMRKLTSIGFTARLCYPCAEVVKKHKAPRGNMVSRQRMWQIRHKKDGKCRYCSEPICERSKNSCDKHRIWQNQLSRELQRKHHKRKQRYLAAESYSLSRLRSA